MSRGVVPYSGGGGYQGLIRLDGTLKEGIKGDDPGCTWHPGSNGQGYAQLITKGGRDIKDIYQGPYT